ncbi:hypothetical protein FAZ69_16415 [Trinickia terrae]|uniref:Uncharacterized protein n=1 Tax=Trinickia terrae TaxID=2571161 RepID=A0A4U1I3R8_9BURK|nr:hypothetical protein [Trinickia terrae]TKC87852.1 hypothetical protein FAZ69_16415 [Trinickia terrae]
MSHELYVQVLSAMFLFWNGARVLTYLPTIGKLLARDADVRSYSLLSWGSWVLGNGTFALMLLEMSRGVPNQMFWMNVANTLMCLVVTFIIVHRRFRWLQACVMGASTSKARIGRVVLWGTPASLLVAGLAVAVAQGLGLGHEPRETAKTMASTQPGAPAQSTASLEHAAYAPAPDAHAAAALGASLVVPAPFPLSGPSTSSITQSTASKPVELKPVRTSKALEQNQNRRRFAVRPVVRRDDSLLTRVSWFFRHLGEPRRSARDHPGDHLHP